MVFQLLPPFVVFRIRPCPPMAKPVLALMNFSLLKLFDGLSVNHIPGKPPVSRFCYFPGSRSNEPGLLGDKVY